MLDIKARVMPIEDQERGKRSALIRDVFECLDSVAGYKSFTKLRPVLEARFIRMYDKASYNGTYSFEFTRYDDGHKRIEVTFYDVKGKDIPALLAVREQEFKRYSVTALVVRSAKRLTLRSINCMTPLKSISTMR